MSTSLVLTVIGPDHPGIVETLSRTVASHEANWLESRMAHLAGQFAGILRVEVPASRADALTAALADLGGAGLKVVVERSAVQSPAPKQRGLRLELVGLDRPGIVRDISRTLAARGINVDELSTECSSAPMSGDTLFTASAELRLSPGTSLEELRTNLELLANELMVDINLDDSES